MREDMSGAATGREVGKAEPEQIGQPVRASAELAAKESKCVHRLADGSRRRGEEKKVHTGGDAGDR